MAYEKPVLEVIELRAEERLARSCAISGPKGTIKSSGYFTVDYDHDSKMDIFSGFAIVEKQNGNDSLKVHDWSFKGIAAGDVLGVFNAWLRRLVGL